MGVCVGAQNTKYKPVVAATQTKTKQGKSEKQQKHTRAIAKSMGNMPERERNRVRLSWALARAALR